MSGLTEQFVVLFTYSCFFALCEGTLEVTAKTGEDVTLKCQSPRDKPIRVIEWSRADLESDGYVFFFRGNQLHESYQHELFLGRVELRDPEMKNGDASVILKNVNITDTGTYECFVRTGSSTRTKRQTELSQFIILTVTEPGHTAGQMERQMEIRDEERGNKETGYREGGDVNGGCRERGNLMLPSIAVAVVVGFVL